MSTHHGIQHATVNDIISDTERRQIPQVHPDDGVAEIVAAFKKSRHARLVYVVDEKQHLSGAISLGHLAKHLLFHLNVLLAIRTGYGACYPIASFPVSPVRIRIHS